MTHTTAFLPAFPLRGPRASPRVARSRDVVLPSRSSSHVLRSARLATKPSCSTTSPSAPSWPDRTTDVLPTLENFLLHSGVQMPAISIESRSGQRGLYAKSDISAGQSLLTIPRSAALRVTTSALSTPDLRTFHLLSHRFWHAAPWHIRLAVRLLDELHATTSPFSAYIASLPTQPSAAVWACETMGVSSIAAQLAPFGLDGCVTKYHRDVVEFYSQFQDALPLFQRGIVPRAQFVWAVANVVSRAFAVPTSSTSDDESDVLQRVFGLSKGSIKNTDGSRNGSASVVEGKMSLPDEFALFPGLDMANHSVHSGSQLRFDAERDVYIVQSATAFRAGEQVYVSYGPKSNDDLVLFYGFVEGGNPANSVIIPKFCDWVQALAREEATDNVAMNWEERFSALSSIGITYEDDAFRFRMDTEERDLLAVLRVALAAGADLRDVLNTPEKARKPLSLDNELAVWNAIARRCDGLLEESPDFTEEEQQTLTQLFEQRPTNTSWIWNNDMNEDEICNDGHVLMQYERESVLDATRQRVRHFALVSMKVGRVCTVLMPSGQSVLRAEMFDVGEDDSKGASGGGAGMLRFCMPAVDDIADLQQVQEQTDEL